LPSDHSWEKTVAKKLSRDSTLEDLVEAFQVTKRFCLEGIHNGELLKALFHEATMRLRNHRFREDPNRASACSPRLKSRIGSRFTSAS